MLLPSPAFRRPTLCAEANWTGKIESSLARLCALMNPISIDIQGALLIGNRRNGLVDVADCMTYLIML